MERPLRFTEERPLRFTEERPLRFTEERPLLLPGTHCAGEVGGVAGHGDGGAVVFGVGKMVVDWCYILGKMVWCRIISHEEG